MTRHEIVMKWRYPSQIPDDNRDDTPDARNLRAQAAVLIAQARGQVTDIQRALGSAPAGSALQSRLATTAAQASAAIAALTQSLSAPGATLHQSDLMALEGVVFSGDAAALVAEAAAHAGSAGAAQAVAAASAATRQEVQTAAHDIFDRKIFDPYLHFSSAEDEAAYRKREEEARHYVEQQLRRGTPEGDLNAGGGMVGQMLDADTHGAGNSPDFLPRWNSLTQRVERQRAAMRAAGQSTDEYDRNMASSVRRFLHARGLSDSEIDQRLAASANPLAAVKPFVKNDNDSHNLEKLATIRTEARTPAAALPRVVASDDTPASPAPLTIDLDAMNAKLKAAGVLMTDTPDPSGHGLTVPKSAGRPGAQVGG